MVAEVGGGKEAFLDGTAAPFPLLPPNPPSSSGLYTYFLASVPTRACQTRSGILHVEIEMWRMAA